MDFSKLHIVKAGEFVEALDDIPTGIDGEKWELGVRRKIEPWLSALFQSEHLSLLLGSGSSIGAAIACGTSAQGMDRVTFNCPLENKVNVRASAIAKNAGRGAANIEDQLSAALALEQGLRIAGMAEADAWKNAIDRVLRSFLQSILASEHAISSSPNQRGIELLASLLLSCASRTSSRERLHIFTTNYDRFIEHAADLSGLRLIDRFVGSLSPVFRASRLQVDMHYNPPGVRGEPRLLEGVCHFTKLHGSLDWIFRDNSIRRVPIAFAAKGTHPDVPINPLGTVMIYPNAAKDQETTGSPFVDLFRDMSAAICRPNSTLICYGYGFGDEHINRIIADMLALPSTHLCVISFAEKGPQAHSRISAFFEKVGRPEQISLLLGSHFADMPTLVRNYLPRPALDLISFRRSELEQRRGTHLKNLEQDAEAASSTFAGPK